MQFVDLKAQYNSIKEEIDEAIANVISDTAFIRGKYVSQFESDFAEKYGVKHCISCANGTDAIYITLKMLGIGAGDEVITVANSWISTSEAISQTGAQVVFVDNNKFSNIDVTKIEEKITSKTKAIIPVHLYGQPAQMDAIMQLAEKHSLFVVEDTAQAHFAEFKGQRVGTFGDAATFSFYPGKNLGAYGDAGCIITNNSELADKMRMYANHGSLVKHKHHIEGINSRMDGMQAAILSVKLKHLLDWTKQRQQVAAVYDKLLSKIPEVITPKSIDGVTHAYHVYCIRAQKRDALQKHLKENGVPTVLHYPTPLPFLDCYSRLNHKPEDFPIANKMQHEIISLPIYPEMTPEQEAEVCFHIADFYDSDS